MRTRVGVNSYIVREISGHGIPIEELDVDLIELGFDDIEVLTEEGINWSSLDLLSTLNVGFTIHSPTSDGRTIAVDLGRYSRRNIRIMENVFRIAQALNARYVVIHGGDIHESYHKAFINTKRQLMELATIAEEYGVKLVIENLLDNRIGTFPHEFIPMFEDNVGFCFDIGHAFITARKYGLDVGSFLTLSPEHVHLHDNMGIRDEHRAIGEGKIPLFVFREILEKGPRNVILEIRRYSSEDSILRSIEFVRRRAVKYAVKV
ncbi:sugar phosphate isomerase/epimerase family protein [Pyrococcus kukulkanii]|uniref:sugar phosphate isomerase/epimerase family protein n=1 Tax=Pyrococcus kukulkanii TaxID=1609559 RepID=UPI003565B0B4